ncbi:hypothetical protein Asppvi_001829 [Aspergillus pseudoviridinutans]|uniref:Uncharacterized protein n=1 Tax=Aspergillus pseudoviridinutans TaxID=1517512 RepID=A0A9P3BJW8_9EURO|nr:uncharacterized protein Asppvi_001829 [Aspergillus pseudoviridinutans]GIJ92551.1 hypothetical protein Asppvi_001829 [Aspergillus pseudoviridinutans]
MGNFESIRPDNPRSNDIVTTMNRLLRSNFAYVIYDTHKPKQLLQGIHERFTQIEGLACQKY